MVVTGIYRISRNPMYLGMLLLLVAWAILLSNLAASLVLPLFVLYMNHFQISPEEVALASRFGADFAAYCKAVRRWL
jgi:protein-S-isoprenylcysteine O-methyltransferase Ste14